MAKPHEADEWCMGQVALGNRQYLETLIRRYSSPLLTFLQRMTGDRHRSEELFQDVFLAVWTKRRQYQFPRPFRSWLFAIAANRCRADYRKQQPVSAGSISEHPPHEMAVAGGPSPVEAAIQAETATLVAAAVARLPAQQRSVVVLRVYNGLKYGEIAEILGRSEPTVRSHMFHALASLREYLEPRLSKAIDQE